MKYLLTRYETIKRVEEVEYEIEIPHGIKSKSEYAEEKVLGGAYEHCRVMNVLESESLDEETVGLKRKR